MKKDNSLEKAAGNTQDVTYERPLQVREHAIDPQLQAGARVILEFLGEYPQANEEPYRGQMAVDPQLYAGARAILAHLANQATEPQIKRSKFDDTQDDE